MSACEMIPPYIACEECSSFPNGYPEKTYLKVSYGGDCWIAYSTKDGNKSSPLQYIGNRNESEPWVVLKFFSMIEWIIHRNQEGN